MTTYTQNKEIYAVIEKLELAINMTSDKNHQKAILIEQAKKELAAIEAKLV